MKKYLLFCALLASTAAYADNNVRDNNYQSTAFGSGTGKQIFQNSPEFLGYVTIGTSAPAALATDPFEVYKNTNSDLDVLFLNDYSGKATSLILVGNSSYENVVLYGSSAIWTFGESGSTSFVLQDTTNSKIPLTVVANSPANSIYIGTTGVAIGTSTLVASTELTVSGNANVSGTETVTGHVTLEGVTSTGATGTALLVFGTAPTLTNPVIVGPAPVACGSTCSPTAGMTELLNQAAGSAVTLPTATGTGNKIRMIITVATTSAQEKVLLTTTSDTIIGTASGENGGTAKIFVGNAGTYHSIQMPFTGSQPSGGFIGDEITCTDIASAKWDCNIIYQAGTTPTTPYSTSTT